MSASSLHNDLIVFDGLIVSNWSREIFENMHEGGLTGANCTCCVWEDFTDTMRNISNWKQWIDENSDLLQQAYSTDDIRAAKKSGKTAIVLGFQNVSAFEDQISYIQLFKELGVGIVQMAYNTQNLIGTGCYETHDGGLSDFGREAVAEMNRVGIMVDVSHAAKSTMLQAVALSKAPVIASHSGARAVNDHSRNLDDEQLRAIQANGGVVQCVALASFLKSNEARSKAQRALQEEIGLKGPASEGISEAERERLWEVFREREVEVDRVYPPADVSIFCNHIDHIVAVAGIDHVGIGSDFDGGGGIGGWQNAAESRNVTRELVKRGYSEQDVQKIWSGNLLRVWRAVEAVSAAW